MTSTMIPIARSTALYICFGPNRIRAIRPNVTAVQNHSGPGPSGPKKSALSAAPDIRAQPGRNSPTKPSDRKA